MADAGRRERRGQVAVDAVAQPDEDPRREPGLAARASAWVSASSAPRRRMASIVARRPAGCHRADREIRRPQRPVHAGTRQVAPVVVVGERLDRTASWRSIRPGRTRGIARERGRDADPGSVEGAARPGSGARRSRPGSPPVDRSVASQRSPRCRSRNRQPRRSDLGDRHRPIDRLERDADGDQRHRRQHRHGPGAVRALQHERADRAPGPVRAPRRSSRSMRPSPGCRRRRGRRRPLLRRPDPARGISARRRAREASRTWPARRACGT